GAEGGALFDDDDAALQGGIARGGEGVADLPGEGGEGFFPWPAGPGAGGADDPVDGGASCVLAEEPLERAVDQSGVGFFEDGAVIPEVCAQDGNVFNFFQVCEARIFVGAVFADPFTQRVAVGGEND